MYFINTLIIEKISFTFTNLFWSRYQKVDFENSYYDTVSVELDFRAGDVLPTAMDGDDVISVCEQSMLKELRIKLYLEDFIK